MAKHHSITLSLMHLCIQPMISNCSSQKCMVDYYEKDVPSAFSFFYTLRYAPLSILDYSHGTSRQRCTGHLGSDMQCVHDQLGRSYAIRFTGASLKPGRTQIYADLLPKHSTHLPLLSAQYHLQEPLGMVEVHLSWSCDFRQSQSSISYHFLPLENHLLAKLPMRRL